MKIIDLNELKTAFIICISTIYSDLKSGLILNHYIIAVYQLWWHIWIFHKLHVARRWQLVKLQEFLWPFKRWRSSWEHVDLQGVGGLWRRLGSALVLWNFYYWFLSLNLHNLYSSEMSHVMRKPVYAICEQQRRKSACASVQSDQRLYSSLLR